MEAGNNHWLACTRKKGETFAILNRINVFKSTNSPIRVFTVTNFHMTKEHMPKCLSIIIIKSKM